MPEYVCRLGTPSGEVLERSFVAENLEALREDLARRDFLVFRIRRKNALLGLFWPLGGRPRRIRFKEFLVFNQEMEALIRAGLPVMACLDLLIERRKNPVLRRSLTEIREEVRGGASLSEAFAAQGDLYPVIYSSSLASGERSGEIATVLRRYIDYTKTMLALRKKVANALVYPAVILTLALILITIMFYFVLPSFADFFKDFDAELPWITRTLLGISHLLRSQPVLLAAAAVGLVAGVSYLRSTRSGRGRIDAWKLRAPFLGRIHNHYCVARFARTLGTLLSGGITLVTSIEIAAAAVGNQVFRSRLETVSRKVREGEALWSSLEGTGLFPDIVVEMVKVGESTASLDQMLSNVADFFDEEIEQELGTIVTLLEPAMLLSMGFVVVGMLMAIYLPLIRAYSATSGY
ncbi:MAG: type II secretion system F family protein [Acidobacteria bacterium]|nr:type II secretion system F family protein [Acidobacteriota bacterium]